MVSILLSFIYRIIVTLIVLVPSITAIVVACTIIYDKDFRKNKIPKKEDEEKDQKNEFHDPLS